MGMDTSVAPVLAQLVPNSEGLQQMIPLVMVLGVFYFLLIRPQQQRVKEHEELVKGLKRGDKIVTQDGLHGKIVELGDKEVTLEIAQNVKVRFERDRIASRPSGAKES